jgi:hypothetical protein
VASGSAPRLKLEREEEAQAPPKEAALRSQAWTKLAAQGPPALRGKTEQAGRAPVSVPAFWVQCPSVPPLSARRSERVSAPGSPSPAASALPLWARPWSPRASAAQPVPSSARRQRRRGSRQGGKLRCSRDALRYHALSCDRRSHIAPQPKKRGWLVGSPPTHGAEIFTPPRSSFGRPCGAPRRELPPLRDAFGALRHPLARSTA